MDDTLELIPRSLRDKLDRVGIKVHLREWQLLPLDERARLIELPCGTAGEQQVFAGAVDRAVEQATGHAADRLPPQPPRGGS